MKKVFALLIILAFILAGSATALALSLYDAYGPMEDWDEETWLKSEEWNDAQWQEYWQGQDAAYELEWAAYEQEQALLRLEQRQKMGLPNPEGLKVKLNEEFLAFKDNQPIKVSGTVYLPLRELLLLAGVESGLSYDGASQSIELFLPDSEVLNIPLSIMEESANYYGDGLLIEGVAYLPDWLICDLLGWDRSFDYDFEILYLVEPEELIARLNQDFSIYNSIFLAPSLPLDKEAPHSFFGSLALYLTLYGDKRPDTAAAIFNYRGLVHQDNAELDFDIQLDLDTLRNSLLSSLDEQDWRLLRQLSEGTGRAIFNGQTNELFLQSNLLPLASQKLKENDWLAFSPDSGEEIMAEIDKLLWEHLAGLSIGRMIYESALNNSYYGEKHDFFARALEQAQLVSALLGDSQFQSQTKNGAVYYTLNADQNKLRQILTNSDFYLPGEDFLYMLFGGFGFMDYLGYFDETPSFSHQLSFRQLDGRTDQLQLSAAAQTKGAVPIDYELLISYDKNSLHGTLEMKGRYGGKLQLGFSYSLLPSEQRPASKPPIGGRIVQESAIYGW